jgi:hypothetical protein
VNVFASLVVGAAALIVLAGTCYGLIGLAQYGLDRFDKRRGKPIPDPDEHFGWSGGLGDGSPLSREALQQTAREELRGRTDQLAATVKAIARHARRHPKAGA